MSPTELLAVVSPIKATLLFAIGPAIDALAFGGWIGAYRWTLKCVVLVCITCLLAIALNLSQYTVIRVLGAGPYQAFSQLKTAAVIVLGTLMFEHTLYVQQTTGALIAVCGVIALTRLESRLQTSMAPPPREQTHEQIHSDWTPLLAPSAMAKSAAGPGDVAKSPKKASPVQQSEENLGTYVPLCISSSR